MSIVFYIDYIQCRWYSLFPLCWFGQCEWQIEDCCSEHSAVKHVCSLSARVQYLSIAFASESAIQRLQGGTKGQLQSGDFRLELNLAIFLQSLDCQFQQCTDCKLCWCKGGRRRALQLVLSCGNLRTAAPVMWILLCLSMQLSIPTCIHGVICHPWEREPGKGCYYGSKKQVFVHCCSGTTVNGLSIQRN